MDMEGVEAEKHQTTGPLSKATGNWNSIVRAPEKPLKTSFGRFYPELSRTTYTSEYAERPDNPTQRDNPQFTPPTPAKSSMTLTVEPLKI